MNWADGQHKAKPEELHFCSICGRAYSGMGNNAKPVNAGRCCNECNQKRVKPARLARAELGLNPRGDNEPEIKWRLG